MASVKDVMDSGLVIHLTFPFNSLVMSVQNSDGSWVYSGLPTENSTQKSQVQLLCQMWYLCQSRLTIPQVTWYRVSDLARVLFLHLFRTESMNIFVFTSSGLQYSFTVLIQHCDNSPALNPDIQSEGTLTIASTRLVDLFPDEHF